MFLQSSNLLSSGFKSLSVALLLVFVVGTNAEARNCKKGKPCGNSCIAQADVCHKDAANTDAATPASAKNSPAASTQAAPIAEMPKAPTAPAAVAPALPPTATAPTTATKTKNCTKGKACGNTCIPKDAVCHS